MRARATAWPAEKLYTLVVLIVFSCAFVGHVGRAYFDSLLWIGSILPALLFSLRTPAPITRAFFLREPFILAFLGLVLASNGWTLLPAVTLRRSLQILATYQLASYLSVRYSWQEFVPLARLALRLSLLLSLAFSWMRPDLGFHVGLHQGLFRGLFGHKNFSARIGSLLASLALASWACGLSRRSGRWSVLFDLLLGLLVLKLAGSRTALLVLVGVTLSLLAVSLVQRAGNSLRLALSSVLASGLGLLLPLLPFFFGVLASLDWNALLTGRVNMWRTVLYFVSRQPLIGFGYGAFFDKATFGGLVTLFEGWDVPHAHNIVIELVADLGVGGAIFYSGSMLLYHGRALCAPAPLMQVAFVVGTFNVLTGLTEITCFPSTEIATLLYMHLALTLAGSSSAKEALLLGPAALTGQKTFAPQPLHGQQDQEERVGGQVTPP